MSQRSRLRLIATTDVHMHLSAKDPIRDVAAAAGLEALAPVIRAARAEVAQSLTLDNGDILQGTPMGEWQARAGEGAHPARSVLHRLGYDAATLGNHEFDFGLAHLARALADDGPPVVCCNLESDLGLPSSVMITRMVDGRPLRIGVTGTVPPRIMVWHREALAGKVSVMATEEAVARAAEALRAEGADLVVCLAHAGIVPAGHPEEDGENSAAKIAATGAVDAIICGHQHMLFPSPEFPYRADGIDPEAGTLHGVPAIMPAAMGKGLGLLDLELTYDGGRWSVAGHSCAHRRPDSAEPDPELRAILTPAEEGTNQRLDAPLSVTPVALTTRFALAEDTAAIRLIHAAQLWWLEQQGLTLPGLSVAGPFKTGGRNGPDFFTDIAPGQITRRSVADLYPFENALTALEATGRDIRLWLEMSASVFNQVSDVPCGLMEEGRAGFNFDSISGLTYEIDLGVPGRFDNSGRVVSDSWRINDLRWNGEPLPEDERFVVVTNTYRSGGGGSFPGVADLPVLRAPEQPASEVIAQFLEAHPEGPSLPAASWSLRAPRGAVAQWVTTAGEAPEGWQCVGSDAGSVVFERRF